jgi:hypothetical protein
MHFCSLQNFHIQSDYQFKWHISEIFEVKFSQNFTKQIIKSRIFCCDIHQEFTKLSICVSFWYFGMSQYRKASLFAPLQYGISNNTKKILEVRLMNLFVYGFNCIWFFDFYKKVTMQTSEWKTELCFKIK